MPVKESDGSLKLNTTPHDSEEIDRGEDHHGCSLGYVPAP